MHWQAGQSIAGKVGCSTFSETAGSCTVAAANRNVHCWICQASRRGSAALQCMQATSCDVCWMALLLLVLHTMSLPYGARAVPSAGWQCTVLPVMQSSCPGPCCLTWSSSPALANIWLPSSPPRLTAHMYATYKALTTHDLRERHSETGSKEQRVSQYWGPSSDTRLGATEGKGPGGLDPALCRLPRMSG